MAPKIPNPTSLYSTPKLCAAASACAGAAVLVLDMAGPTLIVRVAPAASLLVGREEEVVAGDVVLVGDAEAD